MRINGLLLETDATGMGDAGAAAPADAGDAGAVVDDAAGVVDDAAIVEAPAAPDWQNDPAFNDAVRMAAAEIVQQQMLGYQQQQAPAQQDGPAVDWNEALNPLSDNFGQNFIELLQQRDQFLLSQIDERFAPIRSREEAEQIAQGQTKMDELITGRWDETRDGKLKDNAKTAIKDLAPSYLHEMTSRYGEGPLAAEAALAKAADVIRGINSAAHTSGGASNADQLAALAAQAGEPGTAGGAMNVPPPARSPREVFERRFGLQVNGSS